MDGSKEIEQERKKTAAAAAENDAMDIDKNAELEDKAPGEEAKGLCGDSGNQSREVENERRVKAEGEELGSSGKQSMKVENERPAEARDEEKERKETVGTEVDNNGELDSRNNLTDIPNQSVEEKGHIGTSPGNDSSSGKTLVPENQPKDSVQVEKKDEKPKEVSNGAKGIDLSSLDSTKKEASSNGLGAEDLFVRNGAKEEESKNEVENVKTEDSKRWVAGV